MYMVFALPKMITSSHRRSTSVCQRHNVPLILFILCDDIEDRIGKSVCLILIQEYDSKQKNGFDEVFNLIQVTLNR